MSLQPYAPERRPMALREWRLFRQVTHWLASRGVPPNAISLSGMVSGVAAGVAFAATTIPQCERVAFLMAAVLMQLRVLANLLDGMVAVETHRASPRGELYNEVPDRVSDTAMFVGAGYAAGGEPVLGFIAACLELFIAYLRAEGKVVGAHQEFCGPMAKPQRVFTMTVVALWCALAPFGWQPAIAAMPRWGLVTWGLWLVVAGETWTVMRRLARIARALDEPRR